MDAAETREYAKDRANIYPSMNGATSFHPGPGNLKAPSLLPDGQVLHAPNDQKSEEGLRPAFSESRAEVFDPVQAQERDAREQYGTVFCVKQPDGTVKFEPSQNCDQNEARS